MKKSLVYAAVFALLSTFHLPLSGVFAQGTAFTYQGWLNRGGSPAGGNYDFTFALFNGNSTNSGQLGVTQTNLALAMSNGLFLATLDFGSVFTGNPAWLAIGVRGDGDSGFTALDPLQPLTPAPYALYAPNAGTAASASAVAADGVVPLAALPGAVVTNGAAGVSLSGLFSGTFVGDGSGLTNTATGGVTTGNYVFAYDYPSSSETVASGQTKPVSFSTATNLSGWTCTANNTTFTCGQSGLYLVCYYTLIVNNGSVGITAYTPRTGQMIGSANSSGVVGRVSLSQSFLAFFDVGDALQIQASALGGTAIFVSPAGFPGPDASLTIVRVQ